MDSQPATWSQERYRKVACEILGIEDDLPVGDDLICGTMLLAALQVGARLGRIADATGWSRARIRPIFQRLRQQGIFTSKGKLAVEWTEADDPDADIAFTLDVLCGIGMLKRDG